MSSIERAGDPDPRRYRVASRRFPWWILLAIGIIVCGIGIALIVWPFAPVWLLVILFGSGLIANGIALFSRGTTTASTVVLGILLILVGILSIVFVEFTAEVFVTFVGVTLIALGVGWIVAGFRFAGGLGGILVVPAVILLVAGVVTLVWPDAVLTVIAIISGVLMLILGVALIAGAFRMRTLKVHVLEQDGGPR